MIDPKPNNVQQLITSGQLLQAMAICEAQLASSATTGATVYWLYGLAQLLDGQEEEAQATWMMAMMEGNEAEIGIWTDDLIQTLEHNAIVQASAENFEAARLIRQHIQAIDSDNIHNWLELIRFDLRQQRFTVDSFLEFNILGYFSADAFKSGFQQKTAILTEILTLYLASALANEITIHFVAAIQPFIPVSTFVEIVLPAAAKIGYFRSFPKLAIPLLDMCQELEPHNVSLLTHRAEMCFLAKFTEDGITIAQQILTVSTDPVAHIISYYYVLKGYLNTNQDNTKILTAAHDLELCLQGLIAQQPALPYAEARQLVPSVHLFSYISDCPQQYRVLQNKILQLCQQAMRSHWQEKYQTYVAQRSHRLINQSQAEKRLRIGYICSCFYNHSVGWLARSLMQYHDQAKYDIYIYAINTPASEHPVTTFYKQVTPHYRTCSAHSGEIADRIAEDQIDILIELDSITRDTVCTVMALKPAPIQVTWMGWDAVGMSSIDYFIADPYSLPDRAQDYYVEKIWRLPNTFIAIDGFEVGVPSIHRRDLDIPEDAVVFLNPQRGFKLSLETIRRQLQILKNTPNSYLIMKGISSEETLQQSLGQIAQDVGVSLDRVRSMPFAPSEEIHRANLAIADIILDTFPYNGATTTMEALWLERPLVTLVGQQFSARNSYTMMLNAGITEGISWTPEEYVTWGIRLGTEPELRQQIAWKLRQSKQSAPLWNGKAFAQQMEAAYTEMYQKYCDQGVMQSQVASQS